MSSLIKRSATGVVLVAVAAGGGIVALSGPASAERALARAELRNAANEAIGTVTFLGHGVHADRVKVELSLPASAPGLGDYHGFHIHTIGNCTAPAFTSAGGHWNVDASATHGHHTGDLPSLLVSPEGYASAEFDTHRFSVSQLFDANGSAVVLHVGRDNFGNVPLGGGKYEDPNNWYGSATGTGNTGDAGGRYACGRVEPS